MKQDRILIFISIVAWLTINKGLEIIVIDLTKTKKIQAGWLVASRIAVLARILIKKGCDALT